MARGDWGTENRTQSVNSSCAAIYSLIFFSDSDMQEHTDTSKKKKKHPHLGQGQMCSVAEVSSIEQPHFFVPIFVINCDIQLHCTEKERLVCLKIC